MCASPSSSHKEGAQPGARDLGDDPEWLQTRVGELALPCTSAQGLEAETQEDLEKGRGVQIILLFLPWADSRSCLGEEGGKGLGLWGWACAQTDGLDMHHLLSPLALVRTRTPTQAHSPASSRHRHGIQGIAHRSSGPLGE